MTDRVFLSPPDMTGSELTHVHEAFMSNYIAPTGPKIAEFEQAMCEYTGIPHAVALASGTSAIHLMLKSIPLSSADEVWCSTLTFIGGISAIVHEGLTPVFFDSDEASWNMNPVLLGEELKNAAKRGTLPKLVLPTDIYGQSCDLDVILALCSEYEVPVATDSCEAVGTRYKDRHAGNGAKAAAFSFNGNKIITTSGGGMLMSHDESIIDRARYLSTQARQPVVHYEHTEVGYNYRLSNISAAIGCGQLEGLESRVLRRRAIFDRYYERLGNLPGIRFMPEADYNRCTRWLTVVRIDPSRFGCDRSVVQATLNAQNIESRPVWKPMHCQPVFKNARKIGGKVSEAIFQDGLCLPSGSSLSDADVDRVIDIIIELQA